MFAQTHALVKHTHDCHTVPAHTVDNDMRPNQIGMVCLRQVIPVMAELRIATDCLQCLIDLVAIGQQLLFTPGLTGVAQNVDEILMRFRG